MSCMNKEARAKEESEFVQNKINDQIKISTKKAWMDTQVAKIHSGKNGFVGYSTLHNFDDVKKTDLMLTVGYSYLPEKSYAKNEDLVKALHVLLTDFFKTIGQDHPEAKATLVIKYELDQQDNRFFPVESRIAFSQRRFVTKKELLKKVLFHLY